MYLYHETHHQTLSDLIDAIEIEYPIHGYRLEAREIAEENSAISFPQDTQPNVGRY
jgi:hypothetical protein